MLEVVDVVTGVTLDVVTGVTVEVAGDDVDVVDTMAASDITETVPEP